VDVLLQPARLEAFGFELDQQRLATGDEELAVRPPASSPKI
jgi:hypothetical protein